MSNRKEPLLIQYNESWTDEMGFMTGALDFLKELPSSDQSFYGVRLRNNQPEMFIMHRRLFNSGDTYDIELFSSDGTWVVIDHASIRVHDSQTNKKVLDRWRLYLEDGSPLWRRETETKIIQHDNLECVPAFVNMYIPQICRILMKMWRLVNDGAPGPNVPDYDNLARKIRDRILEGIPTLSFWQHVPTSTTLEELYNEVASMYYAASKSSEPMPSGELYFFELRIVNRIRAVLVEVIKNNARA